MFKMISNDDFINSGIHLNNLSEAFHIELKQPFRNKLFNKIEKKFNYKKASESLKISFSHYYHLKSGRYAIKAPMLIKLLKLAKIRVKECERNIALIKSNRGSKAKLVLPLKPSPELASLLGHCFGDGSITFLKREFHYMNTDENLVEKVKYYIKRVFGIEIIQAKKNRITCSTLVGELLILIGAPFGDKLRSEKNVPKWIYHGTVEIRKAFLRAVFDDDGSVLRTKKYASKNINLHFARYSSKKENLRKLLTSIKKLLRSLGIRVLGPYQRSTYSKKGRTRCLMYILISDRENMKRFLKKVGFFHRAKLDKLRELVGRDYSYTKFGHEAEMNDILDMVSKGDISTLEIAEYFNISRKAAYKRLRKLEKQGCVSRKKIRSNLVLWRII